MRDDVWWQDIPFHDRSAITYNGGHEIDGPFTNKQLTPVDIAFTFEYIRDDLNAWNQLLADPVDHIVLNPVWKNLWPYNSTFRPPWFSADTEFNITWQGNFVQWNTSIPADGIAVYLDSNYNWMGLHLIGSLPIMPMHLWSSITQYKSTVVDHVANDLVYGSGPYVFLTRTPGVSLTMISHVAGQTYRGLTLQHSYFYQPVGKVGTANLHMQGQSLIVSQTFYNNAPVQMNVSVSYAADIRKREGDTWTIIPGLQNNVSAVEVDIPPFGTQTFSAKIKVTGLDFGQVVGVAGDFNWTYVIRGSNPWTWLSSFMGFSPYVQFPIDSGVYAPGDINGNGAVDVSDAALLGFYWQKTVPPAPPNVDINDDGIINISDAAIIGANWHKHV